jgi:hypothetical protein
MASPPPLSKVPSRQDTSRRFFRANHDSGVTVDHVVPDPMRILVVGVVRMHRVAGQPSIQSIECAVGMHLAGAGSGRPMCVQPKLGARAP